MASNDAGKVRAKRYNEHGKPYERRRSIIGIVADTVKGLFGRPSVHVQASTSSAKPELEQNHIQHKPGNNAGHTQDNNLGQSYLQPPVSTALHPGPSKLLPQMPLGPPQSHAPAMLHRIDPQTASHRLDPQTASHRLDPQTASHRLDPQAAASHRLDVQGPMRADHIPFSSDHLPFMQYPVKPTSLIVNGGDDRSELSECSISTSGCSSMPPHQEKRDYGVDPLRLPESRLHLRPDLGLTNPNKDLDVHKGHTSLIDQSRRSADNSYLWSGNTSRSISSPGASRNRSLVQPNRSRTPSFNVSIFGSPLSKADRSTILGGGQNDSQFYSGKTAFGGSASQKKRKLQETSPMLTPSKRQVRAKPLGSNISGVSSTSARRILSTLERMSSPIQDAKKIPSYNSSIADSPLSFTPTSFANAARRRTVPYRIGSSGPLKGPPVHAMATPGRVQIAKNYTINTTTQPDLQPPRQSSPFQASTSHSYSDSGGGSRPGKLKQPRGQHYSSKKEEDELVVAPDLPTGFTLTVEEMPKFEFQSPATCGDTSRPSTSSNNKVSSGQYTFSTPIPQSIPDTTAQYSVQNFEFSSPIDVDSAQTSSSCRVSSRKSTQPTISVSKSSTPLSKPDLAFKFDPASAKRKAVDASPAPEMSPMMCTPESSSKPAEQLKMGSVMDVLGSKSSTPTSAARSPVSGLQPAAQLNKGSVMDRLGGGKRSMDTAGIKVNGGEPVDSDKPSLSEMFKKSSSTWECSVCMIQNKQTLSKCAACETAKPGSSPVKAKPALSSVATIPVDKSLAEKFKKPEGSWECDTCMVNNSGTATKCIACETPKPGQQKASSFTSAGGFKIGPTGGFQFQSSSAAAASSSSFSNTGATFGEGPSQDNTDSAPTGGFKFGASLDSKKDSNSSVNDSGNSKSDAPTTGGFKFGQSLGNSSNKDSGQDGATGGFKFGQSLGSSDNNKTDSSTTGGFKFGSDSENSKKEEKKPSTAGGFAFGVSSATANPITTSEKTSKQSTGGFAFGAVPEGSANKTDAISNTNASVTGMFAFGGSETVTSKKPAEVNTSTPTPAFGATPTSVVTFASKPTEGVSSLGAGIKPTVSFGSNKNTEGAASTGIFSASPGGFSMASQGNNKSAVPATETKPAASFNFGKPAEAATTTSTSSTNSLFAFGAAPKTEASKPPASVPSFSFGQSPAPATTTAGFGAQSVQPAAAAVTTTSAPVFAFGASTKASTGAATMPAPSFNFSAKPPADKPVPGAAANPAFNFTATKPAENTATTAAGMFSFSGNKPESPMMASPPMTGTEVFQFGQSASQTVSMFKSVSTAPSAAFAFGGSAQTVTSTASAFGSQSSNVSAAPMFGGSAQSTTTKPPAFSSQPANAFGFGNFTKSASTPAFGTMAKTSESTMFGTTTTTPAFGTAAAPPAFGSTAPAFGTAATANPPAFGATSTPAPAFNTAAQPSSTTPGFGSAAPALGFTGQPAPVSNAPSFQFGQTAPASTAPSTGFNFAATTTQPNSNSPAPPAFGATNTTANFNFSGSQQPASFQFNAQSPAAANNNPFSVTQVSTPARRPIKKATRKLARK